MSGNDEWTSVQKSGKSNSKKKGKNSQKSNEQKPKSADGTAPKGAKGGSVTPTKEANEKSRKESEAAETSDTSSAPWLCIDQPEDPKPSPQNTQNESHKKKNKKKKGKNKSKSEQERDPATPEVESAETNSPPLTNGIKSDSDELAVPKTAETPMQEPEEATEAGTEEALPTETNITSKPDDDGDMSPMSWEDRAEDPQTTETKDTNTPDDDAEGPMSLELSTDDATKTDETEAQSAADREESVVSQASGDATDKDKKSTEVSAGESSPEKKILDSGARQKISFQMNKSPSKGRFTTGPGDGKGSRDQKQHESFSKKPKTESPDRKSQSKGKPRENSREGSSSSTERRRDGSGSREKAGGKAGWVTPKNQHSKDSCRLENQRSHPNRDNRRREKQEPDARGRKRGQGWAGPDRTQEEQWSRAEPLPIVGFELKEIKGDLFQCAQDDAMAHCVSEDLEMGKGIAVLFKESFGRVGKLRAQEKKVGDVAVLQIDKSYVYYLITKERYFHKPRYEALRSSLVAMRDHCKENGVTSVAMPQIGCGLDKLNWAVVMEIIKEVFNNTNMTVKIYYYSG